MKNFNVLGVSSGIGVSLYPFKDNLIANVEERAIFHTPKDEQWKANFGNTYLIKKLDTKINPSHRNVFMKNWADLIISSPDCGSGSIFRLSRAKKMGDHKLNKSLTLFFDAIESAKPRFFLFENLNGLFKSFPEADFDEILKDYRLIKFNEPVSKWGNSQTTRKRLVIVGIRKDLSTKIDGYIKLPKDPQIKYCQDLYGDLKIEDIKIGHVREPLSEVISIYGGKKLSLERIQAYWLKHPKRKRWVVKDRKFTRAPGVYKNNANSFPSTARKANRQYDHNGLTLTPRQLARIQGVPDEFKLYLEPGKPQYWINKARAAVTKCPPYEISAWFKKKLIKTKKLNLW